MGDEKHGTSGGVELNDELIEHLADEAERGYDVDRLRSRSRGRPPIGDEAAKVFHVRLQPTLRTSLEQLADAGETTPSDIVRRALSQFLHGPTASTEEPTVDDSHGGRETPMHAKASDSSTVARETRGPWDAQATSPGGGEDLQIDDGDAPSPIELPSDLLRAARARAAAHGERVNDLFARAVVRELRSDVTRDGGQVVLPLVGSADDPECDVTKADIEATLAAEDAGRHDGR